MSLLSLKLPSQCFQAAQTLFILLVTSASESLQEFMSAALLTGQLWERMSVRHAAAPF